MAMVAASLVTASCAWNRPPLVHVDRKMMPSRTALVEKGPDKNTVVTTTTVCSDGVLMLPSGTVLKYSYPSPYIYSPWRPVYALRLPGRSTWWPCTAVLSRGGEAYFSYFAIPARTQELFRRSCERSPGTCCPSLSALKGTGQTTGSGTDKNPVRPAK